MMMQGVTAIALASISIACSSTKGEPQVSAPIVTTKPAVPQVQTPAEEVAVEPSYAILLSGNDLIRDYGNGKTDTMAAVTGATECFVDPKHQVVWVLTQKGIATHDLVDKSFHAVVPTSIEIDRFAVQAFEPPNAPYPSTIAGNVDERSDCVALVVLVGAEPTVSGSIVGNLVEDCYSDIEQETLTAKYESLMKRYSRIPHFDVNYLKELDARRTKNGSDPDTSNKHGRKAPVVSIAKSKCTGDPKRCGKTTYIGGRFWSVVTANGHGDVYHEDVQLFDATAKEFFDPRSGKRSATPFEFGDLEGLQVSPDKTRAMLAGRLLSLSEGKLEDKLSGKWCGWGPL